MDKFNLKELKIRFDQQADADRAFQMKKYMKDLFPFFGIQANPRRAICSQFLKDSKEFFLRKAIGWALREYSKTNPDWVREFVGKTTMSGLSTREALKRIKIKVKRIK